MPTWIALVLVAISGGLVGAMLKSRGELRHTATWQVANIAFLLAMAAAIIYALIAKPWYWGLAAVAVGWWATSQGARLMQRGVGC